MQTSTIYIHYSVLSDRGFIVEHTLTFATHKEASDFLSSLKLVKKLVGKPVMEIV